jgi:hypothetical protein
MDSEREREREREIDMLSSKIRLPRQLRDPAVGPLSPRTVNGIVQFPQFYVKHCMQTAIKLSYATDPDGGQGKWELKGRVFCREQGQRRIVGKSDTTNSTRRRSRDGLYHFP